MTITVVMVTTAALMFLMHLYVFFDITAGIMRMRQLRDIPAESLEDPPEVAVIIPACNEGKTIGKALRSILDQDYPRLKIIIVDDRSTDNTGQAVALLKPLSKHPLKILRIDTLPVGWLGKSHALQQGASISSADIFLFTDADIIMEPSTISRAVSLMVREKIDHLASTFQPLGHNSLLNAMILDAASGLLGMFKPWKVCDKKNRHFIGVGAFNMIRANCYRECGGHNEIKMHPIDDIMLGKIVKQRGYKQECVLGQDMVMVYWYDSVREMSNGLMKNIFSVFHYRSWLAVIAIFFMLVTATLPYIGICFSAKPAAILFGASLFIRLSGFAIGTVMCQMPLITILGGLAAPFISIYVVTRATFATLRNKGIYWRDTYYPLSQLRQSPPLIF